MAIAQPVAQGAPSAPRARLSCASFPQGDAQSLERPLLVMRRSGFKSPRRLSTDVWLRVIVDVVSADASRRFRLVKTLVTQVPGGASTPHFPQETHLLAEVGERALQYVA